MRRINDTLHHTSLLLVLPLHDREYQAITWVLSTNCMWRLMLLLKDTLADAAQLLGPFLDHFCSFMNRVWLIVIYSTYRYYIVNPILNDCLRGDLLMLRSSLRSCSRFVTIAHFIYTIWWLGGVLHGPGGFGDLRRNYQTILVGYLAILAHDRDQITVALISASLYKDLVCGYFAVLIAFSSNCLLLLWYTNIRTLCRISWLRARQTRGRDVLLAVLVAVGHHSHECRFVWQVNVPFALLLRLWT